MFLKVPPSDHTMGASLEPYLRLKIPTAIHGAEPTKIEIIPDFRIDSGLTYPAKGNKRFNYIRPGVEWRSNGRLRCHCFPGVAYTFHYGSIYRSFFSLRGFSGAVSLIGNTPEEAEIASLLMETGLSHFPRNVDVVVIGNVDRLPTLLSGSAWQRTRLFEWKLGRVARKRVALVGCHHTLWADVSSVIMYLLAEAKVKHVIYIGKLGSLDPIDEPNVTLATGGLSWLDTGELVEWDNVFHGLESSSLRFGIHVTIKSLLEETRSWVTTASQTARFVDPEIGYMAKGAKVAGIHFSYLHVISDNVSRQREMNLSNERLTQVIQQRGFAFAAIDEILTQRIATL